MYVLLDNTEENSFFFYFSLCIPVLVLWRQLSQPCDSGQHSLVGVTAWIRGQQRRSHAPGGQRSPPMARLNQQVHVAAQEALLHVDIFTAVRQEEGLPATCTRRKF